MKSPLVKIFVKTYNDTENPKVRSAYGMLAGVTGIILNILLFACKLFIGYLSHSISVIADSFNNLSDAGSSFVSVLAAKMSKKPADKEHPFGHERIEYIAALVISFIIMYAGFTLFLDSIKNISNPVVMIFEWYFVIILTITIVFKGWLMVFNKKIGKLINSNVQKAAFIDSRNDILVTSLTIVSMFISKYFSISVDSYAGIAVSVFVFISGLSMAKSTIMPLLGSAADKKMYEKITEKVESYKGILGSHDLIVHNYGPSNIMATIHAQVPNDSDIQQVHDIIDRIERDVYKEMGIHLVIHMDPQEVNDVRFFIYKSMATSIIERLDSSASLHDFHIKFKKQNIVMKFEVTVPHLYTDEQEQQLLKNIQEEFAKTDPQIKSEITIEHSYIEEE